MEATAFHIRPCADREELKAYGAIVRYVFAAEQDSFGAIDAEVESTLPEWTMCAFDGDRMAATMGVLPFTVRLNGAPVRMGGVTSVGTLPEFRRRGLQRRIMAAGLEVMREREQPLAILWASMGAIYQRFGYGLASTAVTYDFDPRYACFESESAPTGRVSLMDREDAWPIIKQLYIEYATPRNLHLHRSTVLWTINVLRPERNLSVYIAVYRNGAGEPRGHLVYTTEHREQREPGPNQVMRVRDFIALDIEAYRALWNYIRGHDLVGRVLIRGRLAEDDPAPELLLEPRMLNRLTSDGIWMRVVDAALALKSRPYGSRGELVIAIPEDELCPWNEGSYLLETDGPVADVRRTDRSPDITMPVNTLASLIAGYRSATHFARAGLLEASGERSLLIADVIFRAEHAPNCPNDF